MQTIELIAQRIKAASQSGNRSDDYKVGLVVEGGGMRGVISGGMVSALQALSALGAFDAIYSVSAGSCAAAYLIADQAPLGTSIYYQNINDHKFINTLRFFQNKPIVDIPYLTYQVMKTQKPLNWQRIKDCPIPFHIFVTRANDAEVIDLHQFNSRDELFDALHWTCRLPWLAGQPICGGDGKYYTDGGTLIGGIPLKQAIEDGCTHILVLLTRPAGTLRKNKPLLEGLIVRSLQKEFPALAECFAEGFSRYNETLRKIYDIQCGLLQIPQQVESITIPSNQPEISRLETDRHKLISSAQAGFEAVMEKFRPFNIEINEDIRLIL